MHNLGSAWPAAPPFVTTEPGLVATMEVGGAATLSVAATGTTVPVSYQWFNNSRPIIGATNSTFSLFPVPSTFGCSRRR
jgi:hypothetical protein